MMNNSHRPNNFATNQPPCPTNNHHPSPEHDIAQLFTLLIEPTDTALSDNDLQRTERVKTQLLREYDRLNNEQGFGLTWLEQLIFIKPWRVLIPLSCALSLILSMTVDGLLTRVVTFLTML